jgi:hypothetical protein
MTRYIVTKSFQDRYSRQYYGVGETYETNDQNRGFELENGGYIAQENTEMASMAMQQKANQASQANSQATSQANQQAQKAAEPMTVVNGQVMSVKDAQKALEAAEAANTKTGIQQMHDNSTEAVGAGKVAQQNQQDMQPQSAQINVRQANVQSAQGHMDQHVQSAQSQAQSQEVSGQAHQAGYEGSTAAKLAEASSNPSSQAAEQAQSEQTQSANSTSTAKARATKKGE